MTHELYCKDAGAVSCGGHIRGADEDEFKRNLVAHLEAKHAVNEPNDTLIDYLMGVAKTGSAGEKDLKF
ncbi:MAG: DUF1059 domain-containing protein [Actinobacteria bacterium]|nr:DUF1059 domain-containing protein [Actinomycetota bacterium]MDQ3532321.1 DUF1059 domain-containing protein [Actinomycetota bacterium]